VGILNLLRNNAIHQMGRDTKADKKFDRINPPSLKPQLPPSPKAMVDRMARQAKERKKTELLDADFKDLMDTENCQPLIYTY
jgi:hypothetical protein